MATSIHSDQRPSPIEVWLTQRNIEITCQVVHEDESTEQLGVDSVSMRGAQREITGYLISLGYQPAGRWDWEYHGREPGEGRECSRTFKIR